MIVLIAGTAFSAFPFFHQRSPSITLGHPWSPLVTLGHPWSSSVTLGHPRSPLITMQNSALSKQSAAVSTICLILTIEVDGELGKVKGIKSYLHCVKGARPEVMQYILYYL